MLEDIGATRVVLIGGSLGAAVALQAAADDPRVVAVTAAATFSDLETIARDRAPWYASERQIREALAIAEREARFKVAEVSPVAAARRIRVPVCSSTGRTTSRRAPSTRGASSPRSPDRSSCASSRAPGTTTRSPGCGERSRAGSTQRRRGGVRRAGRKRFDRSDTALTMRMDVWIAGFMALMGAAIAALWTADILRSPEVDLSKGFFAARDKDGGELLWPHWLAEYATATSLVVGAIGVALAASWGRPMALVALGALVYTSANSFGWVFARRERYAYAAPMLVGAAGGVAAIVGLVSEAGRPRPRIAFLPEEHTDFAFSVSLESSGVVLLGLGIAVVVALAVWGRRRRRRGG